MKKIICIFFVAFTIFCGSMNVGICQTTEKGEIYAANLNVLDSLFLEGLDSLIFNSICPEIKDSKKNIFNVDCKLEDKQNNTYSLIFSLDDIIQIYSHKEFRGCFDYKGYLFLWNGDIPEKLLSISGKKRKLTYMTGIPYISDSDIFIFSYSSKKLELKGICCY
ncbi:MAG: hypothetical protein RSD40_05405 [Bacilli bacterium]